MQATRILIYPEGTEEEIEFAEFDGACVVPAVGDRVQVVNRERIGSDPSPWFEVVRRDFYSNRYGHQAFVIEVALHVKRVEA